MRNTAEILRLGQRCRLKHNKNNEMHQLWSSTTTVTTHFVEIDLLVNSNEGNSGPVIKALKASNERHSWSHMCSSIRNSRFFVDCDASVPLQR